MSPCYSSCSLASSPPKQSEVPKQTGADDTATAKSPTADGYPRPTDAEHANAHNNKEGEKEEDQHKRDEHKNKKEKPAFEPIKQHSFNHNPPKQNNYALKQPAGKVL